MQRAFDLIKEKLREKATAEDEPVYTGDVITDLYFGLNDALDAVDEVASEYGGGWIPVSSGRLPEDNKPVLCWVRSTTIASGETFIIGSCSNNKFWFLQTYEIGHHHFPVKDYEVVAWCELPEPYKAESEE